MTPIPKSAPGTSPEDAAAATTDQSLAQAMERVEAVARLTRGIAHDFNNLLTVISGNAEGILEGPDAGPHRGEVEDIADAARRAALLTHQLLAFSRQLVLNPRPTSLDRVLDTVWEDQARAAGPGLRMQRQRQGTPSGVFVDAPQVAQAVGLLMRNAIEAMPNGGELSVVVADVDVDAAMAEALRPMPPGPYVRLELGDTGVGMDPETLRRAMEPFFTTKGQKHGTGMGLPTVYGIVKQSGGFIWLSSVVGRGTTCRLYFPRLAEPSAMPHLRTPVRRENSGDRGPILLVDDEDLVRELTRRTLVRAGYQVVDVRNAHEALVEVRERGLVPSLLLTDVVMPGMDGRELATVLERELPGLPVILMSGFVDPGRPVLSATGAPRYFLEKPFALDRLRGMVKDAIPLPVVS